MKKKEVEAVLSSAIANYIKQLEDKVKEYNGLLEKAYKENDELTERIKQKNVTIEKIMTEPSNSQDADVIVGAITGNVPRKVWECAANGLRNNTRPIIQEDELLILQKELAELIERSLEYKWGR